MSCESQLLQPTGRTCCSHWVKTAGSVHNSYDRGTDFLQVSKWTGAYCRSWKKCGDFDNERAVPECLPEPPHRSRTFSQVQLSFPTAALPRGGRQPGIGSSCTGHPCYSCGQPANLETFHSSQILDREDILIDSFRNADVFKRAAKVVL